MMTNSHVMNEHTYVNIIHQYITKVMGLCAYIYAGSSYNRESRVS